MRFDRRYILKRTLRFLISFFLILTVVFLLPRIAPGDPIENALGLDYATATEYEKEYYRQKWGLDKSVFEQYLLFLKSIFTFDFGYSFTQDQKVSELLGYSMVQSVKLVLPALIIGSFAALAIGVHMGIKNGTRTDRGLTGTLVLIHTVPSFITGILILTVFAFYLGWFPLGHMSTGSGNLADTIYCLTLPVITLSLITFTGYYLIIRSATMQICEEHFIQVEREHGFDDDYINSNHVLRNIGTQFVSMFAMSLGGMISGAMIIEVVFSLNGMGNVVYSAISASDYPVIQGAFIFITASVLIANFIAEVLYSILDPRIADGGV